jgi:choline dehydrogenase-like flavoprotein
VAGVIESGRAHRDGTLRAEVCVIGSGAGGAVVAAELAESGRDVVLLEQGAHHVKEDFDQREETMLPRIFEDAAQRLTEDGAITVLQGRSVGGSTVHNLGYCFRAPEPILGLWSEEHGVRELDSLEDSFARVEAALHVQPILPEELNGLNRAVRRGADLLGYHGHVARHNRVGCVRAGFCILGCSYDAKQSMLVTYVPRADRAGARILTDAKAWRIEAHPGGKRVLATLGDAQGRPAGELRVEAPVVVCSAGAIGTPLILQESGLGGERVGRHLHLHPSVIASGIFPERIHAYYGIPQAYYVDEFIDLARDPRSGYALMPIAGYPVLTAGSLPGFGRELFALLREYPRIGGLLAMLHDRSAGRVERGPAGRPRISYALEDGDRRQLTQALKRTVEVLWASGAERVIVPYLDGALLLRPQDGTAEIDRRGVRQGIIPLSSSHPQSTCRMGEDPGTSVVNSFGEVHGTRGLFVADMSVFPTSLGAPPQITTAALADRTARHLAARWSELRA